MENKMTAVDRFFIELVERDIIKGPYSIPNLKELYEEMKKIEKAQITDAWRSGDNDSMYAPKDLDKQAEQYYNETYGKEYENK